MRLDQFHEEVVSRVIRYALPVADEAGDGAYELLIVGDEQRVHAALADSELEVAIRPGVAEEMWREEAQGRLSLDLVVPREACDDPRGWAKPPRPESPAEDPVLVTLRATRPGGTGIFLGLSNVTLGAGSAMLVIFLGFPPMAWAAAQVQPITGDPDLFLSISGGTPPGPLAGVFSSVAPDGIWDTVWAQMIYGISLPFIPSITVLGFTATTTNFLFFAWA